jgi:hypothetical protein
MTIPINSADKNIVEPLPINRVFLKASNTVLNINPPCTRRISQNLNNGNPGSGSDALQTYLVGRFTFVLLLSPKF